MTATGSDRRVHVARGGSPATRKRPEIILAVWGLLALLALPPVTVLLDGSLPVFTALWLLVPLAAVGLTRDASRVGFRTVPWREFIRVTAVNLGGVSVVMLLVEPWSHTYRMLVDAALASRQPDTTFGWLSRFDRPGALAAMLLYSGLVTMFAEELFFRGWLLRVLRDRLGTAWGVAGQALLFAVPNLIAAFVLPPLQGVLYALVYTWLAVGMIGGWAAARTGSIWPSLVTVTVSNGVFVGLLT